MNKNEYKVNTYVLIKNGEIYEIDEEGCVKKAKNEKFQKHFVK